MLVPWPVKIAKGQQDRRLAERLEEELPGILNWALAGLDEYLALGLDPLPSAIADANADYRQDSDVVGLWIEDCCLLDSLARAKNNELYESYSGWAQAAGHRPMSAKSLADKLRERGLAPWRNTAGRGWTGIAVR
ncbi:phage/plasmid primase, P4 family [mine drainage metagenome]|uniref:Phage/plasmid primase, P4 family n=1 Tax=mine drainage metagenome TaxID=410659 RepID=T1B6E4_9ZZZZ